MLGKGYLCAVVKDANWPTPQAMDTQRTPEAYAAAKEKRGGRMFHSLNIAVQLHGLPAPAKPSTDGSRQESWRTPSSSDGEGGVMEMREGCAGKYKLRDHVAAEEKKKSWATPQQRDFKDAEPLSKWTERAEEQKAKGVNLHLPLPSQVMHTEEKSWATPRANKVHPEITEDNREHLANRNKSNLEEEIAGHCGKATGKLNPRWVEALMGLPIGWTMPSCQSPVTIEPTNCDSSATESSLQQPSEHSELFGRNSND